MSSSEFLKIETDDVVIRLPEFLQQEEQIKWALSDIRKEYPSQQEVSDSVILSVDVDAEPVLDVASQMKREDTDSKIRRYECEELPKLYQDTVSMPVVYLGEHHHQLENFSCTLATTLNAMEALDRRGSTTEADIARAIGQSGSESPVGVGRTKEYLKTQDLFVEELWNALQVIQALEHGGVVSLTRYREGGKVAHQILLSGVKIQKGKIEFIVNDPLRTEAERLSLAEIVAMINHESPNSYVVTKPKDVGIELR